MLLKNKFKLINNIKTEGRNIKYDFSNSKDPKVRVITKFNDGSSLSWKTVAVSENIIEASIQTINEGIYIIYIKYLRKNKKN